MLHFKVLTYNAMTLKLKWPPGLPLHGLLEGPRAITGKTRVRVPFERPRRQGQGRGRRSGRRGGERAGPHVQRWARDVSTTGSGNGRAGQDSQCVRSIRSNSQVLFLWQRLSVRKKRSHLSEGSETAPPAYIMAYQANSLYS